MTRAVGSPAPSHEELIVVHGFFDELRAKAGAHDPRWAPDGKTLYYRGPRHMMAARIAEQPQFAVTKRDTLFIDTFARGPGNEFGVFPNGQQLPMVQRGQAKAELFMVINWQQLIGLSGTGADRAPITP